MDRLKKYPSTARSCITKKITASAAFYRLLVTKNKLLEILCQNKGRALVKNKQFN